MSDLVAKIHSEIARDGPISVARYMELALYDPQNGYYASGAPRTGRSGHYLTSPELDPAFGALWTNAFVRVWKQCGSPERFHVVEVGPGEGGFAHAVLAAAAKDFGAALRLRLVEPTPALRARQAKRFAAEAPVQWSEGLETIPRAGAGVVFVNEVLDNLPVHVVVGHQEIYVGADDGRLVEQFGAYSPAVVDFLARHALEVPRDVRVEVPVAAETFVRACVGLIDAGAAIFVDYGDTWDGLLARRGGTIACYTGAGTDVDYLERPGEKDVTAHVNWSIVSATLRDVGCRVTGPVKQRDVLRRLGLDTLDHDLRTEVSAANAAGDGRRAVRAMSRRGALGALTDPGGLGGLGVVAGTKRIRLPGFDA